jgi:hypothetical protein
MLLSLRAIMLWHLLEATCLRQQAVQHSRALCAAPSCCCCGGGPKAIAWQGIRQGQALQQLLLLLAVLSIFCLADAWQPVWLHAAAAWCQQLHQRC